MDDLASASAIEEALQNPNELETFMINAIRVGMVFGPSIGYFAQMREIRVTHNCEGFSPLLSLILLASNTLRIYYWIGARFDIALLCQAIVMILVQSGLVNVVLRAQMTLAANAAVSYANNNNKGGNAGSGGSTASDSEETYDYTGVPRNPRQLFDQAISGPKGFFDAFIFSPFPSAFKTMTPALFFAKLATMALIFGFGSLLVYSFWGYEYAEIIGYTALSLEGCLYLPQIHLNFKRRSTEGLTWVLLCTWVFGDVAKLLYFVFDDQPFPFIVCSCFQLTCDAVMLFEVFWFRKNKRGHHDIASVLENGCPLPPTITTETNINSAQNTSGSGNVNNLKSPSMTGSTEMSTLRVSGSGAPNNSTVSSSSAADGTQRDVIVTRGLYGGGGGRN